MSDLTLGNVFVPPQTYNLTISRKLERFKNYDLTIRILSISISYKKTLKLSCSTVAKTIQWFNRTSSTQNRPCHGQPKKLSVCVYIIYIYIYVCCVCVCVCFLYLFLYILGFVMGGRGSVFSGFEGCMCISPPTKSINKKCTIIL